MRPSSWSLPHSGPQNPYLYRELQRNWTQSVDTPSSLKKIFFNVLEILTLEPEELAFRLSFSFAFKSQFLSLSFLINKKRRTYFALPGHVFKNLNLEDKSLSLV